MNDKSVLLVNYKDELDIMRYPGLPGIPVHVQANPLKIGFFNVIFKNFKSIAELHSASTAIKSYIKIENQTIVK